MGGEGKTSYTGLYFAKAIAVSEEKVDRNLLNHLESFHLSQKGKPCVVNWTFELCPGQFRYLKCGRWFLSWCVICTFFVGSVLHLRILSCGTVHTCLLNGVLLHWSCSFCLRAFKWTALWFSRSKQQWLKIWWLDIRQSSAGPPTRPWG